MNGLLERIMYAVRTGDVHHARFWTVLLVRSALWHSHA